MIFYLASMYINNKKIIVTESGTKNRTINDFVSFNNNKNNDDDINKINNDNNSEISKDLRNINKGYNSTGLDNIGVPVNNRTLLLVWIIGIRHFVLLASGDFK